MASHPNCAQCRSLAFKYPEVAKEWDYSKNKKVPEDYYASSKSRVYWKCEKGHMWESPIFYRTNNNIGCPKCSSVATSENFRKLAVAKKGSLLDANPDYLSEWDYDKNTEYEPSDLTLKSNVKAWWNCPKGHSYEQSLGSKARGSKCPVCSKGERAEKVRLARLKKNGSLQDHFPKIAYCWHSKENGTMTPDQVTTGAPTKYSWICSEGHEWVASVLTMTDIRRTYICPVCKDKKVNYREFCMGIIKHWDNFAYEWQKGATEIVLIVISLMAASLYSIPFIFIAEIFELNVSAEDLAFLSIIIVGPFHIGKNSVRFKKKQS